MTEDYNYIFCDVIHNIIISVLIVFIFKQFFLAFIYFSRDRVRQSMSRGGPEREGDTESEAGSIQALSCQHRARHGAQTMNHEIMT